MKQHKNKVDKKMKFQSIHSYQFCYEISLFKLSK